MRNLAAATEPGTKVGIEIMRDGKPLTIELRVTQRDTQAAMAAAPDVSDELGISVADMTPQEARSFGIEADTQGVVVTQVDPSGLAYLTGIRPGNLIVDVQGVPVHNVTEFQRELGKHDLTTGVRLVVQSGDMRRFVLLRKNGE